MTHPLRTVVVTGSRDLEPAPVVRALRKLNPDRVLVGCCPTGADLAAREWCAKHGVPCRVFRARWGLSGRRAGPLRNARMIAAAVEAGAFCVLAFPRGGPGTRDCMNQATAAGLAVVQA